MSEPIRVLLAEDHEIVRDGYKRLFERTADIVVEAEAGDGASAVALYAQTRPDAVVMDIGLPGLDGLAATEAIVASDCRARIVVFSVRENPEYAARAIGCGALGYLSKRCSAQEMIKAIRTIALGRVYIAESMREALLRNPQSQNQASSLTERQLEVLRLVAGGQSMDAVAGTLGISEKTAGHHLTAIKKALAVQTRAGLALAALRAGCIDL